MSLETAQYLHQLNVANPSGADKLKEGDDHIRLLKAVLRNTFPGLKGPLAPEVTHDFLNALAGQLVPSGIISLWHGAASAVPAGWAICDGSKVPTADGKGTITTPDLRGRVPVGVSADYELLKTFGQVKKTVTSAVAGGHEHTGAIPGHTHATTDLKGTAKSATTGITLNLATKTDTAGGGTGKTVLAQNPAPAVTDPGHTHEVAISGALGNSADQSVKAAAVDGHSHSVEIDTTQPSIALHFIIKV